MNDKLLPCPFCGGEPIQCGNNELNPRHWVMCKACHACPGGDVPELADAMAAWNRRSSLAIRAGVTGAMVNAADSVLSRRRPGIPDETIRLAIAAAFDAADRPTTPSPTPKLRVTNPTTIAQFVSAFSDHGVTLPLQVSDDDVGTLIDANEYPVLVVDVDRERSDEDVAWIVGMIQVAVNTCGGFKAQIVAASEGSTDVR